MGASYALSAREARKATSALWAAASQDTKNKWFTLSRAEGYEQLAVAVLPRGSLAAASGHEAFGAMLTWQSSIGRANDKVSQWAAHGFDFATVCELMAGDAELNDIFISFCAWLSVTCKKQRFHLWSAAMEANPSRKSAVVHLHAYVCVNWRFRGKPEWQMGSLEAEEWRFGSFAPHVQPTIVHRNANVQKLMTSGLFYCVAPKVGSIFRYSELVAGKDCGQWAGFAISFVELPPRRDQNRRESQI
jgi:hypothetical protein